jgi:hypothetical protein
VPINDLCKRLSKAGVAAKAAISDTPGCSWGVARYGDATHVSPGRASEGLGSGHLRHFRNSSDFRFAPLATGLPTHGASLSSVSVVAAIWDPRHRSGALG